MVLQKIPTFQEVKNWATSGNISIGDLSDVTATGEGSGNGLNADTVDGKHASDIGAPSSTQSSANDYAGVAVGSDMVSVASGNSKEITYNISAPAEAVSYDRASSWQTNFDVTNIDIVTVFGSVVNVMSENGGNSGFYTMGSQDVSEVRVTYTNNRDSDETYNTKVRLESKSMPSHSHDI